MVHDAENKLKESIKEHSDELAKSGVELGKIQFSYKMENKSSKEYWQKKIEDFKKYSQKGLEYYNQAYSLINLINKEESQMFLLRTSKFRQMGLTLIEIMEKIKENPSIMDSKDRQQSQWSRKIKNEIIQHADKCLGHEREMNVSFREFYEKHLKNPQ